MGPPPDHETAGEMRLRRPVGPKPPKSWLNSTRLAVSQLKKSKGPQPWQREDIPGESLGVLPDLYLPEQRSLMFQILKGLARNWQWHVEYDQYSLAVLPTRLREALVGFIARYNPQGINRYGLEILFMDDVLLEDAGDNEDVAHLDLSMSIGHNLSLKELKHFLVKIRKAATDAETTTETESIPENWDAPLTFSLSHNSVSRFPNLTHLSLSHPSNVSWKSLLNLAPYLATLTHLSLAFWPCPTLDPLPLVDSEMSLGYVSYGSGVSGRNWSEAGAILRQLSKKMHCLKWLDLTGCCDWIWALQCEGGIDWNGAWRRLESVKVGQGWMPDCLKDENMKLGEHGIDRFEKDSVFGFENRNCTGALSTWLRYEKQIEKLEQAVNGGKTRSARNNAGEASPSVSESTSRRHKLENWWDECVESSVHSAPSKNDPRDQWVRFERGWEGWWIDEAIQSFLSFSS